MNVYKNPACFSRWSVRSGTHERSTDIGHAIYMQAWFIGRTPASQAGKGGSIPLACSIHIARLLKWLKRPVSKTGRRRKGVRRFKSCSGRHFLYKKENKNNVKRGKKSADFSQGRNCPFSFSRIKKKENRFPSWRFPLLPFSLLFSLAFCSFLSGREEDEDSL